MIKEKILYFFISVILICIITLIEFYKVEPFESFSLRFNDINFELQQKEPSKEVVFVAVDEPSVNEFGRWPWKREIIAKGLDVLVESKVVLMDMIFSEPTTPQQDEILANSLANLDASVCGFFLRHNATQKTTQDEFDILNDSALDLLQSQVTQFGDPKFAFAPYAELNIVPILESCSLSGIFSTIRATDDKLRDYPIAFYFQDILYPSLAIAGLRLMLDQDIYRVSPTTLQLGDYLIHINENSMVKLNFYHLNQYKIISFLDLINHKIKPEYFKDKIVILGITEVGAGDIVSTPIGTIPGPLLHYTFLSNLLEHHLIIEKKNISFLLTTLFILVPFIALILFKNITLRMLFNILMYLISYGVVRYLFVENMLYIDLFYPLVGLFVSMTILEGIAFYKEEHSSRFIRNAFSSYLSNELLEELIINPNTLSLGGQRKELSILFSDIRGFTAISESMEPEELVHLVNAYFTPMTQAVLEHQGMLDKYIGDAIMAFFNAPVDVSEHADKACLSALKMIEKLKILNTKLTQEKKQNIFIGIGINSAEVIVGNMGSDIRFNYTIMGDGVNLTARVESLTKYYGVQILITEFTFKKLQQNYLIRQIEAVVVKGKVEAVMLYELLENNEQNKEKVNLYNQALSLYKDKKFKEAKKVFEEVVKKYNDTVSTHFIKDIQNKKNWGIKKMDSK
jgi:adenylate cyclase